jgi:hypothetical protein
LLFIFRLLGSLVPGIYGLLKRGTTDAIAYISTLFSVAPKPVHACKVDFVPYVIEALATLAGSLYEGV